MMYIWFWISELVILNLYFLNYCSMASINHVFQDSQRKGKQRNEEEQFYMIFHDVIFFFEDDMFELRTAFCVCL